MTDHDAFEELLALRLYGELDAAERARLERHLSACEPCRALADELESGLGRLLRAPQPVALPPAARAGLAAAIAGERRAARRPVRAALLGFAAGVLCALGVGLGMRAGAGGSPPALVAPPAAVFARATPPPQALDRGLGELLGSAARR